MDGNMSQNFRRFLMKAAESPEFVQKFRADPEAMMDAEGLSEAEKGLIRTKDPSERERKIRSQFWGSREYSNILILIDEG